MHTASGALLVRGRSLPFCSTQVSLCVRLVQLDGLSAVFDRVVQFVQLQTYIYAYANSIGGKQGAVALRCRMVLRGTILNYFIFIGCGIGSPRQRPTKMTQFRIATRRITINRSATPRRATSPTVGLCQRNVHKYSLQVWLI